MKGQMAESEWRSCWEHALAQAPFFWGEGFCVRQFGHYNSIKSAMVPRKFKRQNKWHKKNGSMTHVKELFWETPSFQWKQLSSKIPPCVETELCSNQKNYLSIPPKKTIKNSWVSSSQNWISSVHLNTQKKSPKFPTVPNWANFRVSKKKHQETKKIKRTSTHFLPNYIF